MSGVHAPSSRDEAPVGAALRHRLVVALDGSPSATPTMEWAAAEAADRGASLNVVVGLNPQDADVVPGADLLIVGASSSGAAEQWLLDSAPRTAARRGSCPVIVVRGRLRRPLRRIVVGLDESNASVAALEWAVDEADRQEAEIIVIHAWQRPWDASRSMRRVDLDRSDAQCIVDLAVRHVEERTSRVVRGELIEGEASVVLTAASGDADLLAVGSRGPSGFKTMLFGSVALFVAEHASCPVAVIHPRIGRVRTNDSGDSATAQPRSR